MKVLFVHKNLGDFGGAENFVTLAASELSTRGHTASLLYSERTGKNEKYWRELFPQTYCFSSGGEHLRAILERTDPDIVFLQNWEHVDSLQALVTSGIPLARMVHDHSLYCLREYKYNYFTRRICTRAASGACVFPCLGTFVRNREGRLPVAWKSYTQKQRELALNRQCALVLAYSNYQREELLRNGFDPARVKMVCPIRMLNREGVTTCYNERNIVLFAGQIIRGKGVDALLRALAKVHCPFEAIILGDGNHRSFCERLAKRLGLEQKVRFAGYVTQENSKALYLQATVFAMSSLWPEPFGMAGPEAMRYGIPVVGFDAGAIGEWLQDGQNGFLIPWNDTTQFAARIEQLLRDKNLARALGSTARASVQRFDVSVHLAKLEALLLGITGNVADRRSLAA